MKTKKTEERSIKLPLNRDCPSRCLNSRCTLMVIIPDMMLRAICCKNHFV